MVVVSKLTRRQVPADIRMKMLVLHAPEKLGLKQEYIQEHQAGRIERILPREKISRGGRGGTPLGDMAENEMGAIVPEVAFRVHRVLGSGLFESVEARPPHVPLLPQRAFAASARNLLEHAQGTREDGAV